MKIEFRLRQVLAEHRLEEHGVQKKIADEIGVQRPAIARLYHNRAKEISLDMLGRICRWLEDNSVPAEELPQSLFGRSELWESISRAPRVRITIGEYEEGPRRWVSTYDVGAGAAPGIHYLEPDGSWSCLPWRDDRSDAAVVLTRHDTARHLTAIALIGYSGRATRLVTRHLVQADEKFWPPQIERSEFAYGVHVCRFTFPNRDVPEVAPDTVNCEVVPMDDGVLDRYVTA